MNVSEVSASLAAEDEAVAVDILDQFDEPAMFGGTPVERDGETVIEGAQPVQIGVCGMNSKQHAKARAWQRRQTEALGGRKPTDAQNTEIWCGYLARCCRWWKGFFGETGEPLPFTTDTCADVLQRLPFVERQVAVALGNAQRFRRRGP
jgi:hypothetical protein